MPLGFWLGKADKQDEPEARRPADKIRDQYTGFMDRRFAAIVRNPDAGIPFFAFSRKKMVFRG